MISLTGSYISYTTSLPVVLIQQLLDCRHNNAIVQNALLSFNNPHVTDYSCDEMENPGGDDFEIQNWLDEISRDDRHYPCSSDRHDTSPCG